MPKRDGSGPFLEKRNPFLGVAVDMGEDILKLVLRLPPVPAAIRNLG